MKLDKESIKRIVADAGDGARLKDLGYAILCLAVEDPVVAYRMIYNQAEPIDSKAPDKKLKSACISKMTSEVQPILFPAKAKKGTRKDELDQDEIRERLMSELKVLTDIRDNKSDELDAKDYASISGRIADILVKLKEKFGAVDRSNDQRVVVLQKYNDICPYCHREISVKR